MARLRVVRAFKGATETSIVSIDAGRATCELRFGAGQRWIVYADTGPSGLRSSLCSGSRQLDANAPPPDLRPEPGVVDGWLIRPQAAAGIQPWIRGRARLGPDTRRPNRLAYRGPGQLPADRCAARHVDRAVRARRRRIGVRPGGGRAAGSLRDRDGIRRARATSTRQALAPRAATVGVAAGRVCKDGEVHRSEGRGDHVSSVVAAGPDRFVAPAPGARRRLLVRDRRPPVSGTPRHPRSSRPTSSTSSKGRPA